MRCRIRSVHQCCVCLPSCLSFHVYFILQIPVTFFCNFLREAELQQVVLLESQTAPETFQVIQSLFSLKFLSFLANLSLHRLVFKYLDFNKCLILKMLLTAQLSHL